MYGFIQSVKVLGLFTLLVGFAIPACAQNEVLGLWQDEEGETIIKIYRDNGLYNGQIVWLEDSLDFAGRPRLDVNNTNPSLRSRRLKGIDLIYGFQYYKNQWIEGKVYDYHSGRTYNARLRIDGEGALRLKGYYGILSFLGKTKYWYRVKP